MEKALLDIARWIERRYLKGGTFYVECDTELLLRADALTKRAETEARSGEWRRHQVYAAMLKDFPAVSKREIAMAIELALRS